MRLNIERQNELEPKRIDSCKELLEELGYSVQIKGKALVFAHRGRTVTFWPYSGWHSGASVKAGRGFKNLLNQLL